MRFVERDRVPPPRWFYTKEAEQNRRDLQDFFSQTFEGLTQTRVDEPAMKTAEIGLEQGLRDNLVTLFDECCAFCETRVGDDAHVHRFRPIANAEPAVDTSTSHLYYAWLAEAWQNLYPICNDCRPDRTEYFPVKNDRRAPLPGPEAFEAFVVREDGRWPEFPLKEAHVFADPCYDEKLWRHFRFLPHGMIIGRDRTGRETIAQFKLDRNTLTRDREAAFRTRQFALEDVLAGTSDATPDRILGPDIAGFPGASLIYFREVLGIALGKARPSANIAGAIEQLTKLPDALDRLIDAIARLDAEEMDLIAHEAADPEELTRAGYYAPPPSSALPAHLAIRNYKSLEKIDLSVPDAPQTRTGSTAPSMLILGENAAGKSTILEALALALTPPGTRRMLRLDPSKLVLNPKFMGSNDPAPETAEITLTFPGGATRALNIRACGDAGAGFSEDGAASDLPLFAYGAFRQYLDAERRNTRHRHIRSLFEPDELLSNPEKWLLRLSPSDFSMVARALRKVFSIEASYDVLARDADGVYVVSPMGTDGTSSRTPLSVVSSGFRAVLAMLCDIMQGLMNPKINSDFESLETATGLVLIDEIESHLHPRWKVSIMTGLRKALPQVCFIATSHDPLCLRGMHKGEVLVLERVTEPSEQGLPVTTQALVDLPDNQNWTIQQLLTADFFQLRSTEAVDSERNRAAAEDALARGERPEDNPNIRAYLAEISATLPIGDTEVQRLVHEAIADYLAERRTATRARIGTLRDATKARILKALRGYDAPN